MRPLVGLMFMPASESPCGCEADEVLVQAVPKAELRAKEHHLLLRFP